MPPLPAVSREPAPSAAVDELPPAATPAPHSGSRLLGAGLAIIAGIGALAGLAVVSVVPGSAAIVAPFIVLLGGAAFWGAARIDHAKLRIELDRLAAENRRLATTLESLADTAWELNESEERYRNLIDAQGDLVVHRGEDGRVTFVNPAFARTFDIPPETLVGKPLRLAPLEELNGGDEPKDVRSRDMKLATASGPRWYAWVDIRVRDDKGALGPLYSVARDITARKEVEEALVESRRRAEAANQAKSRFLATVSHEFRTPLNGILGLTSLLLETSLTPDQETYTRGVHSSGEALLALVDDILDFSKIEAGRLDLHPESTELETLLQDIVELLAARAHGKGIDIAADLGPDLPARVMVDPTRLRQVLLNLAGNGVKFTEAGGVTVSVRVETPGEETARILFSVADTGPGIPPEESERVFGEFEQGDSALTRRHGGTGLGLAISQKIVRQMGGDIALESWPSGGSLFSFVLDLPLAERTETRSPADLKDRRILILAPEGAEPPALARSLAQTGATARLVRTAHDAASLAGAAVAAALPYDALLVDQRAAPDPGRALSLIRAAAGVPLPAAILIEPGKRGEVEALKVAGFDAYLIRPVRRSSLFRIVGDIISSSGDFRMDPSDARPRRAEVTRGAAASLEILLAEDNEINALLARAVLEGLGHTVTVVREGSAAVAAATERQGRFAAILMDLHMPGLDGLAATRAIRAYEDLTGGPRAAIVALTADVLPDTRAEAEAAGIDAVLEKPVTPDSLRRRLAELTAG
jgi:PAS domain S-box-containing protein